MPKKMRDHDFAKKLQILVLVFCCVLVYFSQHVVAPYCLGNSNTVNSTFVKNLNYAFSSFSNITANKSFYNVMVGKDPDRVYALALCRGDYNAEICSSCIQLSIADMLKNCPERQESVTWGPNYDRTCIVRYANRPIFNLLETFPAMPIPSTNNISVDMNQFNTAWYSLMDRLVASAVTGNSSYNLSYFATGQVSVDGLHILYGMVQCTPDLSQTDCSVCLYGAAGEFQSCCRGKQGGSILRPSCFIKSELFAFYGVPPPYSTIGKANKSNAANRSKISLTLILIVAAVDIPVMLIMLLTCIYFRKRRPKQKPEKVETGIKPEALQYEFDIIKMATNDFSDGNKLGQGGFGAVYKGRLPDGQDIAVKRLAGNSAQGEKEFKNEVLLLAKLQHRNLVKLLGFCLKGEERLLVYEFVPNKSLNHFIFDSIMRANLDWEKRYKIIGGIARGLLYLHEDSRHRIIHRDLKASNILLDNQMNPKISDFGMARLFDRDETQGSTSRIVGTYGYMAPEYALHGHFSVMSDVYSFGVLVLEIISGQKNKCFFVGEETEHLLSLAWRNWREGTILNFLDPVLGAAPRNEIMRCIHLGLLCVQENVVERPTMASIILMLNSNSTTLRMPSKPAFLMYNSVVSDNLLPGNGSLPTRSRQSRGQSTRASINEVSTSELCPR